MVTFRDWLRSWEPRKVEVSPRPTKQGVGFAISVTAMSIVVAITSGRWWMWPFAIAMIAVAWWHYYYPPARKPPDFQRDMRIGDLISWYSVPVTVVTLSVLIVYLLVWPQ